MNKDIVTLAHGSGGRKMHRLIKELFLKYFSNPILARLEDSAEVAEPHLKKRFALTTDSYVVQPVFFPGGDIGKLAVCGTVNDLAVKGALPKYLSASFIIREGFSLNYLEKICQSMAKAAKAAKIKIVTGDTKVIERSTQEEIYITTSGVGVYNNNYRLGAEKVQTGDLVLINGAIGEHETAIILARGQFEFKAKIISDCASLNGLITNLLKTNNKIRMMRDPTRGGLATTLNEIAELSNLGIIIDESKILIKPAVKGICELLGFDPLYLANEGKVVIIAARSEEKRLLAKMRKHRLGKQANVIGEIVKQPKGVWVKTKLGSIKPLLMLEGQQLPRIC
ncbi:MAG: hydrogenase expression/formation protein HypE [candidate division WOR-3 bacterium]|nr:hydrogenase expression/formation protein HypE [candidate division WOR-3 bacterium]